MLKKILIISSADGILKLCGYLLLPVYLNLMPKEDYGEFGYITSVVGALPPILTLGLYVALIKGQSESKDGIEKNEIFSSILASVILFVGVFCLIAAALGLAQKFFNFRFVAPIEATLKTVGVLSAIFFATVNLIVYSHAVGLQNTSVIVKYNLFKFIFANAFGIGFLVMWSGSSDESLKRLYGFVLAEIILFAVTFLWLCRDKFQPIINLSIVRRYVNTGIMIVPGSCASLVTIASDRYFLSSNFGLSYVAEYNLAMQFVLPMQLIMTGAQTIWAPHVYSISRGLEALDASTSFLRKITFLFLIGLGVISASVYVAILLSVIPSIYQDVAKLVPILGVSAIFLAMTHIFHNLFVKFNKPQYVSYLSIAGAVITVVAGYLLIPVFGYWAAALLSVFINALLFVVNFKMAKRFALA